MGWFKGCRLARQGAFWLFALALYGCGGGGSGSGGGGQPPAPVPIVTSQSFSLSEDTAFSATIQTSPTNGATFSVQQTTQPQKGTITSFGSNGSFTYQPNANEFGQDTFSITATDSAGKTGSAVVTLNVASVNDAPVAANDKLVFDSSNTVVLDVLTNDSDVESEQLNVELLTPAAGEAPNPEVGTAVVNSSNQIVVSLPANFRGATRVRYQAKDASGSSSEIATAAAFVGTRPVEAWYSLDGVVYASDLLSSRQITTFETSSRAGNVKFSADKSVAIIEEVSNNRVTALYAVSTGENEIPQRMTPPLALDEIIFAYSVNKDGSWIAYVVEKLYVSRELWVVARQTPAEPKMITLPGTFQYIEEDGRISPMAFNATGDAIYFVAESDNMAQRLYRAAVATPTQPDAVVADEDPLFISQVGTFFVAASETHLVVDLQTTGQSGLYRISLPVTSQRTLISSGEWLGSIVTNSDLTRVAYTTLGDTNTYSDDRVFIANVASTAVSVHESVSASLSRTGPVWPLQVRPDGEALLLEDSSLVSYAYRVDIAEAAGDGTSTVISVPAVNDMSISQYATYDTSGDSIVYLWTEEDAPSRLIEIKRGSFDQPIDLLPPGAIYGPLYSSDMTMLTAVHQANSSSDSIFRVRIVNRSAPGLTIDVTSGPTPPNDIGVFGLVETD